jgi:hypothetical protein
MNLDISGYRWQSRRADALDFFHQQTVYKDRGFLVNNRIDYIYLVDLQRQKTTLNLQDMSIVPIFDNGYAVIYRVKR